MLIAQGAISQDQLQKALAHQAAAGGLVGEVLIGLGYTSEQVVAVAVSSQTGIPFMRIGDDPIPAMLLKLVPEESCRKHRLIPVGAEGNVLRLAMANPFDIVALDAIRLSTSLNPSPSVAAWGDIRQAIDRCFPAKKASPGS
jgi:type IV pilus assembly protein PilB